MSADRARDFLSRIEVSNVGAETLDQLADDVRRYWSGRWEDSLRYAQLGTEAATRSRGTAGVLLASSEARALAALNRLDEVHVAVATNWTSSAGYATSVALPNSTTPPKCSPGAAHRRPATPKNSPSKR